MGGLYFFFFFSTSMEEVLGQEKTRGKKMVRYCEVSYGSIRSKLGKKIGHW